MGKHAYMFVDFLKECGLSVWQVLPIHPPQNVPLNTPHRDFLSPYQPQSVHAGNPMLIDLQKLIDKGWLPRKSLPSFNNHEQLEQSFKYRRARLKEASIRFFRYAKKREREEYQQFVEENNWWLDDYALFCALKYTYRDVCWWKWPVKDYSRYEANALEKARNRFAEKINQYKFIQFAFFKQWYELKEYAHQKGIYLFGDMPFFVARDSVDVWNKRDNLLLDEEGKPLFLSGSPPINDYFCPNKGQCWGHPLYNWDNLQKDNLQWWIARLKSANRLFDLVRLTHFRGFYQCWAIPANDPKPRNGKMLLIPGEALFSKFIEEQICSNSSMRCIAEDVGVPKGVKELRNKFKLPGIKILQLAFDLELRNHHLPHHHSLDDIIYIGTHDSNTTAGWFQKIKEENEKRQKYLCDYLNTQSENVPWAMIQAAFQSVAKLAIIPMQDILNLDAKHRMNTPGTSNSRNWRWQFKWLQVTSEIKMKLKNLVKCYERN
jgi:4-alpha-glucanotransferase